MANGPADPQLESPTAVRDGSAAMALRAARRTRWAFASRSKTRATFALPAYMSGSPGGQTRASSGPGAWLRLVLGQGIACFHWCEGTGRLGYAGLHFTGGLGRVKCKIRKSKNKFVKYTYVKRCCL